jgi:predicted metal-dependent phosphoesterase TrpH
VLCDLHLHTTKSDGVWTPERLFEEIRRRDLQFFSITDHDCLDAYPVPEDLRSRCIPGLEVDSHHGGHTVHILAYGIDDKQSPLLQALQAQRQDRLRRMQGMVDRLNALGLAIAMDDVLAQATGASSVGRPHLARALVERGHVATVQEAFDRYIADDGDGYVALERMTSARIIELIHESGGAAVLAHPLRLRDAASLEELCNLGVDGIEVTHPTADADAENMLRVFAHEHNLLVTGGTDFHAPVAERLIGVEITDWHPLLSIDGRDHPPADRESLLSADPGAA